MQHGGRTRSIIGGGPQRTDTTATDTVADIISALERSSPSLSEGVMVVATGDVWSGDYGDDTPPRRLLRALQPSGRGQPVYTVDADRLLADGHHGAATEDAVDAKGHVLPAVCVRPAEPTHHGTAASLLPPRSRYVVLFRDGPVPRPTSDPFVKLASLNRTFWDTDVYYVIVVQQFDPAARQTVYAAWRDLSIYKYAINIQ